MKREEFLISGMHDITICKLGDVEEELEQLEDLVVKRDLLRKEKILLSMNSILTLEDMAVFLTADLAWV